MVFRHYFDIFAAADEPLSRQLFRLMPP